MKTKKREQQYKGRRYFFYTIIIICFLGVLSRAFYLQVMKTEFLNEKSTGISIRDVKIYANRGLISDRNGEPLAITTPVYSIWLNPQKAKLSSEQIKKLSFLLKKSEKYLRNKSNNKKHFVYLKRHLPPYLAKEVIKLNYPGVYKLQEYRRFYPMGEVAANLLGFTNIDDQGQEGVELAFNEQLKGKFGKKRVLKNRLGQIIDNIEILAEPKFGKQLTLTINSKLQYMAHSVLKKTVNKYHAKSGSAVILNVNNGEILAMVMQPSFNPNNPKDKIPSKIRNRVVTDVFEPGSVMKPFSILTALQNGYNPEKIIDTSPGWFVVGNHTVKDIRNYGVLNLAGVLRKSSNVAVSKIILQYPPHYLVDTLHKLGFGKKTMSGLPGESAGVINIPRVRDKFSLATLAFGYGISVNLLQLVQSYAVLGSLGIYYPLKIKKDNQDNPGTRVIAKKYAKKIIELLAGVTQLGGSGTRANVPGYSILGKTGTVRKLNNKEYDANKHIGLFVGLIPAKKPLLAMAIMIDEPKGKEYFGGQVAAPVFAEVMTYAMRLLDIPTDSVKTVKNYT